MKRVDIRRIKSLPRKIAKGSILGLFILIQVVTSVPETAFAAASQIRQEINIIDTTLTSTGTLESDARIQLDTTKYSGTATYYFEAVYAGAASNTGTIKLARAGTTTYDSSIAGATSTSYTLTRSAAFVPPAGQTEYTVKLIGDGVRSQSVKAARIVVIQGGNPITSTETQIEFGAHDTGKTNTSTSSLTTPKYWEYDASSWNGTQTYYMDVTYKSNPSPTGATYFGTTTWQAPAGVTSVTVEAWGGGGGGGAATGNPAGGSGGAGGQYVKKTNIAVTPGNTYTVTVGGGGTGGTTAAGGVGGDSWFSTSGTVIAKGGAGGGANQAAGGTGSTTGAIGDVGSIFAGGNGAAGTTSQGGGGGGGAGTGGAGGNASGATAGTGTATDGGNGGAGRTSTRGAGSAGNTYGGGGGGGYATNTSDQSGGIGGAGQVKLTYNAAQPVNVVIQEFNPTTGAWSNKTTIVSAGSATTATRVRATFTPIDGRKYRVGAYTVTGGSYDIYNAKVVVDQTFSGTPIKLEPQYQLANAKLDAGTSAQSALAKWDTTDWSGTTNTYVHQLSDSGSGTSRVELDDSGGTAILGSVANTYGVGQTLITAQNSENTVYDTYSPNIDNAGLNRVGQTFQSNGETIAGVVFYLNKTGTPTGNAKVLLTTHTGTFGAGRGTDTIIAVSDPIDVSTIGGTASAYTFTFSGQNLVALTNGAYYSAMLDVSETVSDASNLINFSYSTTNIASGNLFYQNSSSAAWASASANDSYFRVGTAFAMPASSGNIDVKATTNGNDVLDSRILVRVVSKEGSCRSQATGNWNSSGTWDCGHVPTTGDDVTISAGNIVTMDVNSAVLGSIAINGTLNTSASNYSLSGTALMVRGTLTANGSLITLSGSGSAFLNSGTINAGTSTFKLTNTGSKGFSGGGATYNNIWNAPGAGTGYFEITGDNTFNDFRDDGSASHTIYFAANSTTTVSTFTVTGDASHTITINSSNGAGLASPTVHNLIKTGAVVSSDYLNIQHSAASPANTWYAGTHSINNQSVATAGSGWTFTAPPPVTCTSTGTGLMWNSTGTWTCGHVPGAGEDAVIASGHTITLDVATASLGSVTIGGTLVGAGFALTANTLAITGTLNGSGSAITIHGTGTPLAVSGTVSGGTFYFDGNGDVTIPNFTGMNDIAFTPSLTGNAIYTLSTATIGANGLYVNPTAASAYTLTINPTTNVTTTGDIVFSATGSALVTYDLRPSTTDYNLQAAHLTIGANTTLDASSASSLIQLTGTSGTLFTRSGTFTRGTSDVYITGTGSVTLLSAATTFYDLEIAKSLGTLTLGADTSVNDFFNVNGGTVQIGTANLTSSLQTTVNGGTLDDNSTTGTNTFWGSGIYIASGGSWTSTGNANYTLNSGDIYVATSGSFSSGTGTYTFAASGTQSIYGNQNISFASGSTIQDNNTSELDIYGNLTSAGTITVGSNAYLNFVGTVPTLTALTATSGTVMYTGSGAQTVIPTTYNNLTINKSGGTATLGGSGLVVNANFTLTAGTFDANNQNISITYFSGSNTNTRALTMGSGTWTITGIGLAWDTSTTTGLTITPNTSTIKFTDSTSTYKKFAGGGMTFNNIWFAPGSGTGLFEITGSNTFNDFKDDGTTAHTLLFTAGTTTTVSSFTVSGHSSQLITINSGDGSEGLSTLTHTLTKSGGVISSDYLNIQHSIATPANIWYAGTNSTNNQAVANAGSGWIFTAPPASDGTPYGGSAWTVPGTIQTEDFNVGGEGVAYHDSESANQAGQYRPSDGVDIETSQDTGGGYDIGWTANGEWMKYTINVNTAGNYTFGARVGSLSTGVITVQIDGSTVVTLNTPNTSGYQTWQTATSTEFALTTGTHVLRVDETSAGYNLNYFTLTYVPPSTDKTYLVDFGLSTNQTSTTGWNNLVDTTTSGPTLTLVDTSGATSTRTLHITDSFYYNSGLPMDSSVNSAGTSGSSLYPPSATNDSFFLGTLNAITDTSAQITVGGLNNGNTYDFRFYASRVAGDAGNRTTDYTIGATTVSLNATDNINNYVDITGKSPSSGSIVISIAKNASATFGYLGVLKITEHISSNASPTANAGTDQSVTMPVSSITLSGSGSDTDGTIASYAWTETSSNYATINSPSSATTTVKDLAAGTYTFRLTVTDDIGATGYDDVIVTVGSHSLTSPTAKTIVVLGSSTSAGYGISPSSDAYVNRFATYFDGLVASNSVVNLAVSGYTTYQILPTGTNNGARPAVDTAHNITQALTYSPAAILVNMPSNDTANGYSVSEQETNFQTLASTAAAAGVPIYFTTTQPRNGFTAGQVTDQTTVRDWILSTYGTKAIDFWTTFAQGDGTINPIYDQGDGIHLNNVAHKKLYARVAESTMINVAHNLAPTANAGNDQSITLPTTTTTLSGSGSDTDGTIASYAWSFISGPSTPSITSATSASTGVTALSSIGTYVFRLTVTDDLGKTGTDDINVVVSQAVCSSQLTTANWNSTATWSCGRVPTTGDNVVITAGNTITMNINSAVLGTITINGSLTTSATNYSLSGTNLTIASGGTLTANGSTITLSGTSGTLFTKVGTFTPGTSTVAITGAGTTTLLSAATTFNNLTINNASAVVSAGAAPTVSGTFTLTAGSFDAGSNNITAAVFSTSNSNTRSITLGSGTWSLTSTGTVWDATTSTGLTITPGTSTIKLTNSSATLKTFSGGGKTYNNIWFAPATGTGIFQILGSNTFNDFKDDGTIAHTILFTTGTTTTVSTFTVTGNASQLITINTGNGSGAATTTTHALVKSTGGTISSDYLSIQHSVATPANTWYAGTHSTNNQATVTAGSGWVFTAPPPGCASQTATGNWNAIGTWQCGRIPTTTDAVTITAGNTITMDVDSAVLGNITVAGTLNTSGYTLTGTSLTVTGTLSAGASAIVLIGTGTPLANSGTFTAGTSTVKFEGDGAVTIPAAPYYSVTLDPTISTGRTYTLNATAATGDLTISPAGSALLTVNMGADLAVTGTTTITRTATATSKLDAISGTNKNLTTGYLNVQAGGTYLPQNSTLSLSGAGTGTPLLTAAGTFTPSGSTMALTGNGSATINAGTATVNNLTLTGTGTKTAGAALTLTGSLTVGSGSTFNGGGYDTTIAGSVTNNGTYSVGSSSAHYRAITIDHTKVPNTDQSNFPVLISGTYTYLKTTANGGDVANANGYDIRFFSDSSRTVPLKFQREKWNASTGEFAAWVKVPTVSHTVDTTIYMSYGDPSITTEQADPANVWDSNFQAVWHMGESGSTISDSTANANTGTKTTPSKILQATGTIGDAQDFEESGAGRTEILTNTNINATLTGTFTFSAWVNVESFPGHDMNIIRDDDGQGNSGAGLWVSNPSGVIGSYVYIGGAQVNSTATTIGTASWKHIVARYNNSALETFINGTKDANTTPVTGTSSAGYGSFTLGNFGPSQSVVGYFDGLIDEVEVSSTARSDDWIKTEYNNQSSPSTFYGVGTDQFSAGGSPTIAVGGSWTNANTFTDAGSTIKLTDSSSSSKTFAGGGASYNRVWFAPGAGTGSYTISGNNTFGELKDDGTAAHSVKFTAGSTQTIGTWSISGTSGNLITIDSTTTGTHALVKSAGTGYVTANYLNIQHSVATPVSTWYAGDNSISNQSVDTVGSGWIFASRSKHKGGGGGNAGGESSGLAGTCVDGQQNGNETGIDTGGRCASGGGSGGGGGNAGGETSGMTGTCSDNVKNGNETGIDQGGRCATGGGSGGGGGDSGFLITPVRYLATTVLSDPSFNFAFLFSQFFLTIFS